MFRTLHRKCWRSYLSLARARARLTTWRHSEQRDWFGKLSTNKLLMSLWLLGAAFYTAHASYISNSECGSGLTETAAEYPVKVDDGQVTGSVGQEAAGPPQNDVASRAARANIVPSVWGIRVIEPEMLREGWISGEYLAPESPQAQAAPQKSAPTAPETSAVSETEPPAISKNLRRQQGWKWRYARRPPIRFEFSMRPRW